MTIQRSGKGYTVRSESGKRLSKTLPTKKAAQKRLGQVEYFKKLAEHTRKKKGSRR